MRVSTKRHRCYDELRNRVNIKEWGIGPANSVWGPILDSTMAKVWARLLFPFTYSSATLFVQGLDGNSLRIILEEHNGGLQPLVKHSEKGCSGEMFKIVSMMTNAQATSSVPSIRIRCDAFSSLTWSVRKYPLRGRMSISFRPSYLAIGIYLFIKTKRISGSSLSKPSSLSHTTLFSPLP